MLSKVWSVEGWCYLSPRKYDETLTKNRGQFLFLMGKLGVMRNLRGKLATAAVSARLPVPATPARLASSTAMPAARTAVAAATATSTLRGTRGRIRLRTRLRTKDIAGALGRLLFDLAEHVPNRIKNTHDYSFYLYGTQNLISNVELSET